MFRQVKKECIIFGECKSMFLMFVQHKKSCWIRIFSLQFNISCFQVGAFYDKYISSRKSAAHQVCICRAFKQYIEQCFYGKLFANVVIWNQSAYGHKRFISKRLIQIILKDFTDFKYNIVIVLISIKFLRHTSKQTDATFRETVSKFKAPIPVTGW